MGFDFYGMNVMDKFQYAIDTTVHFSKSATNYFLSDAFQNIEFSFFVELGAEMIVASMLALQLNIMLLTHR